MFYYKYRQLEDVLTTPSNYREGLLAIVGCVFYKRSRYWRYWFEWPSFSSKVVDPIKHITGLFG